MKLFRPKLVIFDLDGTLVEFPKEYIFSEAERILPELSHPPVHRDDLERHFSAFDFFGFVDEPQRDAFISRFWGTFDWSNYPKPTAFEWTKMTLCHFHERGIATAIATARLETEEEIRSGLLPTGCLDFFSCIRSREGDHVDWKDKRGQIGSICGELGVSAADAVLVGDIPADILSARSAGIGFAAAVLSGGIRRDVLAAAKPDLLLEHIGELPGFLDLE